MIKNIKTILAKLKKAKTVKTNGRRREQIQFYFIVIYKDQKLSIGLIGSSNRSHDLVDDLIIDIKQLIVDKQYVRDTEKLSNMIEELTNLLSIENNIREDSDIPVILLLDSVNFSIMQLDNKNTFNGLTTIRESLIENHKEDVFRLSPFIESDTLFDIFAYEGINNEKINIQYTSKRYITSWIETLRKINKKVAYIGSCNIPILLDLMSKEKKGFLLFDIGKSKSKIFVVDNQQNILEHPFPYGFQQFMREGVVDETRLIKQFTSRLNSDFTSGGNNYDVVYVAGITKINTTNLNGKQYKCLTTIHKKELARCKKNDKITMTEENFRTICILTKELL